MEVEGMISSVHSVQNAFQVLTSALAMTAYLFPPQANIQDGDKFDYIVVGAGSAGSVIATRLSEDPDVKVLLMDAGGDPPMESVLPPYFSYLKNSKEDWNYTSITDENLKYHKDQVLALCRAKMLGGCSSHNLMCYVRGSPDDFDSWAALVDDESWNYENVLPYFKKIENFKDVTILNSPTGPLHGTEGYVGVIKPNLKITHKYLKAFEELGYNIVFDTNGNDTLGYQVPQLNIYNGVRQSTAYSYLGSVKNRSNLYVAKNTLVKRVIFDENNNAIGVEATTEDGRTVTLFAYKETIISAGAINSPKLLMLSGIGPRQHLVDLGISVVADLPVGKNLQDHAPILLVYTTGDLQPQEPTGPHSVLPSVFGFVTLNKSQNYPDYQSVNFILDKDSLLMLSNFFFTYEDNICQKFYEESNGKEVLFALIAPLLPKSRGRILLRSTNSTDKPLIRMGVFSDEQDIEDVISYAQDFNRVTESEYFQRVGAKFLVPPQCSGFELSTQEYWQCHARSMVTTVYHYVGTCAMGSVVDSRLRVYGVNRLRVADGSIMPTITRGNTNAPIMMIGEKAAAMIKVDNNCRADDKHTNSQVSSKPGYQLRNTAFTGSSS